MHITVGTEKYYWWQMACCRKGSLRKAFRWHLQPFFATLILVVWKISLLHLISMHYFVVMENLKDFFLDRNKKWKGNKFSRRENGKNKTGVVEHSTLIKFSISSPQKFIEAMFLVQISKRGLNLSYATKKGTQNQ